MNNKKIEEGICLNCGFYVMVNAKKCGYCKEHIKKCDMCGNFSPIEFMRGSICPSCNRKKLAIVI